MGIDPRPFSLRQLYWMASERKRVWGELAAWHLSGIVGFMPFTGKALNPAQINPYGGVRRDSEKLAKIKAFIAGRAWVSLTRAGRRDED